MTFQLCLVEDHDWLRDIYTNFLNQQPELHVSAAFASAEECLSQLPADTDLVLIDISLKGMSGIELVRHLHKERPSLPCIILSGQSAVGLADHVKAVGAVRYIEKGDTELLLSAIHEVVEQKRAK